MMQMFPKEPAALAGTKPGGGCHPCQKEGMLWKRSRQSACWRNWQRSRLPDLGAEPAPPVKVGDKLRALELIYKYLGLGDGAAAEEPVVIVDEAPTEQEVTP